MYECVKEIARTLRATYKGIGAHSYGYCCGSDYDAFHKNVNTNDYVDAKIYKGGLNNQYEDGSFRIGNCVYFSWNLTNFALDEIIASMTAVANKYGFFIDKPESEHQCIKLVTERTPEGGN
jgi:hypothetical protein